MSVGESAERQMTQKVAKLLTAGRSQAREAAQTNIDARKLAKL